MKPMKYGPYGVVSTPNPWTPEDVEVLKKQFLLGLSYPEIAKMLNRSAQKVRTKGAKLGLVRADDTRRETMRLLGRRSMQKMQRNAVAARTGK